MILIALLGFLLFAMFVGIIGVLVMPSKSKQPQQVASPVSWHAPAPVQAQVQTLTAREQDRQVQSRLVAEWYAQSLDDQFKKETLDDIAAKLAARKP